MGGLRKNEEGWRGKGWMREIRMERKVGEEVGKGKVHGR